MVHARCRSFTVRAATRCRTFPSNADVIVARNFTSDGWSSLGCALPPAAYLSDIAIPGTKGEWIPNGRGREKLEAVEFIRRFNELAHCEPGAVTVAESPPHGLVSRRLTPEASDSP